MKRLLLLAALFAALTSASGTAAPYPLGTVAARYPYVPSKLLADPVRNRIYAADTISNSVIVIDTTTLQVIAAIPIGSDPVDMAISRDGNTLYVANGGSTLDAIGVLDLNTLAAPTNFSLPGNALAIAAGLSGRVYVAVLSDGYNPAIYQLDGATGEVQATFNQHAYDNNLFQISPDGTTLFVASTGLEPGSLQSFDVSTPTAAALQSNFDASDNDSQLVISHHGRFICLPSGGGNPGAPGYSTLLLSTADIDASFGSFNNGYYPGPLAFSPDDSLVYQTNDGNPVLNEYSTQTFANLAEVALPIIGRDALPDKINSIVADNTGSYLFIAEVSLAGVTVTGQLAVVTTGSGPLTPSSVLPTLAKSTATATQGTPFTYQIAATGNPTSYSAKYLPKGLRVHPVTGLITGKPLVTGKFVVHLTAADAAGVATANLDLTIDEERPEVTLIDTVPAVSAGTGHVGKLTVKLAVALNYQLVVYYSIRGSAVNGTNYELLTGAVKFGPGERSKPITIMPRGDLDGAKEKLVKIQLETSPDYEVGTKTPLTVTIHGGRTTGTPGGGL